MFIITNDDGVVMFGGKAFKTDGEAAEWLGDRIEHIFPNLTDEEFLDKFEEYMVIKKE